MVIISGLINTDSQEQWSDTGMKGSPMPVNWESSPTVKSIKKNRTDHRGEMGSLERASGYAMNAKPNPANTHTRGKKPALFRPIDLYDKKIMYMSHLTFLHHLSHRNLVDIGHVAQYGKYGEASKHAGTC